MTRRKPKRVRCPYCDTVVTGSHVGMTDSGWGCKVADRCMRKSQMAQLKQRELDRNA